MTRTTYPELIEWIGSAYGHCLPFNVNQNGQQFETRIRGVYDCGSAGSGPVNDTAARIAGQCPGVWHRSYPDKITYSQEVAA